MVRKLTRAALVALAVAYMAASCALETGAPPSPSVVAGEQ